MRFEYRASALRQAANAVENLKDTAVSNFFKRSAFRKDRKSAKSAAARKLAVILWSHGGQIRFQKPTISNPAATRFDLTLLLNPKHKQHV